MEYLQYLRLVNYTDSVLNRVLNLVINGIPSILKNGGFSLSPDGQF